MSAINPKNNVGKTRKGSKSTTADLARPTDISSFGSPFGKPLPGQSNNPNKNYKSLSNGLGMQVDKEVAGASMITAPNKKRTLL